MTLVEGEGTAALAGIPRMGPAPTDPVRLVMARRLLGVASERSLRDVAREISNGFAEKLALVVNRANSGVSVADMEQTTGMTAMALIRSGGMLFVRAANEGRTVIDMYPNEKISEDFDALADRVLGATVANDEPEPSPAAAVAAKLSLGFLSRKKAPLRA